MRMPWLKNCPILAEHHPERIGVGGPVDIAAGTVAVSTRLKARWFPLRDWLHELTELPVVIENDANTAALGEALRGAGRGFNPAFYMNMGSGVGGGLVIEEYHSDKPGEVEVGHLRLDPDGTTVEDRCSGWAVDRAIRDALRTHPESLLNTLQRHAWRRIQTPAALAQNDPLAQDILTPPPPTRLCVIAYNLHPRHHSRRRFITGGVPLHKSIEQQLPEFLMDIYGNGPQIKLADSRKTPCRRGCSLNRTHRPRRLCRRT